MATNGDTHTNDAFLPVKGAQPAGRVASTSGPNGVNVPEVDVLIMGAGFSAFTMLNRSVPVKSGLTVT